MDIAQRNLKQSLKPSEALRGWEDRKLNSDIYRALVLNCEQMRDIAQMKAYLGDWISEHPDDQMSKGERDRLHAKFRLAD